MVYRRSLDPINVVCLQLAILLCDAVICWQDFEYLKKKKKRNGEGLRSCAVTDIFVDLMTSLPDSEPTYTQAFDAVQ